MASISIPAEKRQIDDPREIASYVAKSGLSYERWDVAGRIAPGADSATVLEAYAPEIERLKKYGGYVTADVIDIKADTPNLDAMLAKFNKEHAHAEDEVLQRIARRDWQGVLSALEPDARAYEPVRRRLLFRHLDAVRHWMPLGDR